MPTNEIEPSVTSIIYNNEPVICHYTNYHGLSGIVSSKSLWCTKIQYLNDREELRHGFEILSEICKKRFQSVKFLEEVPEAISRSKGINLFISSFSEKRDLLSQWRGYSGGGGLSIDFSFRKLRELAVSTNFSLVKCVYDELDKELIMSNFLEEEIRNISGQSDLNDKAFYLVQKALKICATFKNASFSEESEWRLISPPLRSDRDVIRVRSTANGLVPYYPFDLSTGHKPFRSEVQPWRVNEDICICSVMVGPNQEQELQVSAVGHLFDEHDAAVYGVTRSAIPYRQL